MYIFIIYILLVFVVDYSELCMLIFCNYYGYKHKYNA